MPKHSFSALVDQHDAETIRYVSAVLTAISSSLAREFYRVMLSDDDAKLYLDHNQVESRMFNMFDAWARGVLRPLRAADAADLQAAHTRLGEVHARVSIPMDFIYHGMQVIKTRCFSRFIEDCLDSNPTVLKPGVEYINDLFDTALSVISAAYLKRSLSDERSAQALRFRMASADLSIECERMKTELVLWTRDLLFANSTAAVQYDCDVYSSAFGAWLTHKAPIYFASVEGLGQLRGVVAILDEKARAVAEHQATGDAAKRDRLLSQFKRTADEVFWHLDQLVEQTQRDLDSKDPVTHLYNRRFLDSILRRENHIAKTGNESFALIMLDIDDFKGLNDSYGHAVGDRVLGEVASIILRAIRQTDFCFRYGGDELLILLTNATIDTAKVRAQTILRAVREAVILTDAGTEVRTTISVGCAAYIGHPDYETVTKRADAALYNAKMHGKNRVALDEERA